MDSDSDLEYMTVSESEEEFPPPPRRRRRRHHHWPRGCRASQRVQRQRLAAARAATFTTLPTPTAVVAAAHAEDDAELRSENKRLQEELNKCIGKCNELRERVWTLLNEVKIRRSQPPPSAPPQRSQPSNSRHPPYPRQPSHEARRQESGVSRRPVARSLVDAGKPTTASLVQRPRRPRLLSTPRSRSLYWTSWWRSIPWRKWNFNILPVLLFSFFFL